MLLLTKALYEKYIYLEDCMIEITCAYDIAYYDELEKNLNYVKAFKEDIVRTWDVYRHKMSKTIKSFKNQLYHMLLCKILCYDVRCITISYLI